ncbi:hypothetical protein ASPZODRAFT_409822 [Penicilliopsis zonata CBS 506.65]|uniref:Gfo/Idh/MocA-like oxidoreductase N-terminal domain-containing protein n=1 Tax=Penicilliopsis zonata CBS 506.65 TaxID=1073090 RepID=A0A1L9SWF9_9EURO|nr:hypothetical protein ASPZODRAFT_409822 [Penicilliopsis zonata CBS 506.65]OJJ51530.1 hypothetical protein ASPZODRAFT_409822 [Penicilliopsis zonata CBS 506.65]
MGDYTPTVTINPSPISKPLRFLVIGAGSRGNAYARAVRSVTNGVIHAVAEPHAFKRREFGEKNIWGKGGRPGEGQEFDDWKDWLEWETERRKLTAETNTTATNASTVGVDGVFICTLDETHVEILQAITPLKLHILCEKPLAISLTECLAAYRSLSTHCEASKIFSVGHVLRYSPHNMLLRQLLLLDRVVGDIVSLEHCEPVGWWHFSHSYVRGNWRRETVNGDGSLLTKSCHDIDFILWMLCSPSPGGSSSSSSSSTPSYHFPRSISSFGSLTQFRRARKPIKAGNATNCLSCPAEPECIYSAVKIYDGKHLAKQKLSHSALSIVCPDIEDVYTTQGEQAARQALLTSLSEDYDRSTTEDALIASRPWYGRCVYEADNSVCDDQVVILKWDDQNTTASTSTSTTSRTSKTALFHMIAPTEKQCERRGRVYGTKGEVSYDSETITIHTFESGTTTSVPVPKPATEEEAQGHGGGDYGLVRSFVQAVDAVENKGYAVADAQRSFIGCTLEEAVRSHAVVFAAEEARRDEKVVKWDEWWEKKIRQ